MIDAQTRLYAVIGNPVRHSLSPVIHNMAFQRMGHNAVYLAFEVQCLEDALKGLRGLGIRGVSVTLPFKTRVIPYLDGLDPMAEKVGAVNTIVNEEGRLVGHNTDGHGAVKALEEKVHLQGKRVYLLGAGGAARAIGFGLKGSGCEIILFNRSASKARELAGALGCESYPLSSVAEIRAEGAKDILINATSVGMHSSDGESPVPERVLKKGMTVMDIVYSPPRTRLLREAEEAGCQAIDGLEMLAHQGVAQLELWIGMSLNVQEIKEDLRKAIE